MWGGLLLQLRTGTIWMCPSDWMLPDLTLQCQYGYTFLSTRGEKFNANQREKKTEHLLEYVKILLHECKCIVRIFENLNQRGTTPEGWLVGKCSNFRNLFQFSKLFIFLSVLSLELKFKTIPKKHKWQKLQNCSIHDRVLGWIPKHRVPKLPPLPHTAMKFILMGMNNAQQGPNSRLRRMHGTSWCHLRNYGKILSPQVSVSPSISV